MEIGKASPFQAYKENEETPFGAEGIVSKWVERGVKQSGKVMIDQETGETMPVLIPKSVMVDHDSKVYVKLLKDDRVKSLTPNGKVLLMYVAFHLKVKSVQIELYWSDVTEWCGLSRNSYYRAVCDLLDNNVLAIRQRKKNLFFVNPNFVFNGDRTKVAKRVAPPKDIRLEELANNRG